MIPMKIDYNFLYYNFAVFGHCQKLVGLLTKHIAITLLLENRKLVDILHRQVINTEHTEICTNTAPAKPSCIVNRYMSSFM